jgi:hypothetical protein
MLERRNRNEKRLGNFDGKIKKERRGNESEKGRRIEKERAAGEKSK